MAGEVTLQMTISRGWVIKSALANSVQGVLETRRRKAMCLLPKPSIREKYLPTEDTMSRASWSAH